MLTLLLCIEALKSFSDTLDLVTIYTTTYPNDNVMIK
jgi:hypothetical protein